MSLPEIICQTARNLLFKMAARSDHFRQWVYPNLPKSYTWNPEVEQEIEQGMLRGLSAEQISKELYSKHS